MPAETSSLGTQPEG